MTDVPETQYAVCGDDHIAYQVFGKGDVDLLWVPASGDCIDLRWDWPPYARFLDWLGTRARVISFDRRGTGASDAPSDDRLPLWERGADDFRAVLDAVGSTQAVICAVADSGAAAVLYTASNTSRVRGLILVNGQALANNQASHEQFLRDAWGTSILTDSLFPDLAKRDPLFRSWWTKNVRMYMPPNAAAKFVGQGLDVRESLQLVRVPTLVLHHESFDAVPVESGRYLAEHIAGARFVLLPGGDAFIFTERTVGLAMEEIDLFLSGLSAVGNHDRALAAVLFTDIVGSTAKAAAIGDQHWRHLLETHDAVARTVVEQHRGRVIKMTGDGMLATFDGPGRAIRSALSLIESLGPLGIEIRAGLHTGEVELRDTDIAGIGVHIAARVMDTAAPGELVVSPAVPMLVAGSGIEFEDRGDHELKGVPGTWRLFTVVN